MNVTQFKKYKSEGRKISMVTAYDYQTARLVSQSDVDVVLVGDSVAMVCHGYPSTVHATMPMMQQHTAAVRRGCDKKFLVADMPIGSYRKSVDKSVENAVSLLQSGAEAVKLEGADGNLEVIHHLVESGVPVMGHVGLTPQFVNQFGGHKVQGKTDEGAQKIIQDAKSLEQAGCFSIVIECVPSSLAKFITQELSIPTIGIGAGSDCDGQVLVFYDMLGFQSDFRPKFVRRYAEAEKTFVDGINQYHQDVLEVNFPNAEEEY